jgi:phenylalanyl-tRNA synthetase beta chain
MKISLNTIRSMNKRYGCADDVAKIGVDKLIERIGSQLGAVEEIIDIGSKYRGIVIAKVVSCGKHANANKLSVCFIDDGGATPGVKRNQEGHIQVVCGAPNVREGLTVAWLPPGSTVPATVGKEPFVLEAREIRGQVSNGMLASSRELALNDDHDRILEIDGKHRPGADFAESFGLKNDVVIDIENKMFTHRPDCFGFLGVSRELAGIQGLPFKSPDWYKVDPKFPAIEAEELKLEVRNELPELVPRFTAITMRDVRVGPSPVWLQVELAKVGQNSVNNIVDYTNFFMLETGQPLHAYDYDKVKALSAGGAAIVIRNPKPGEKIKLLNGKTIEPRGEAIMIATDKQLIGIGGVMGGADTEVDKNTKNIILECANFDMYSIRRTSMAHGLFTDAVTRFTKGQSPLQNAAVLAKIVDEIHQYAGGKVAGRVIDNAHIAKRDRVHPPVPVSTDFINARLGLKLSPDKIKTLLENVEFIVAVKGGELTVTAPFWRTDIELREDVVEEVGRLYGYDHLPLVLPRRDLAPAARDPLLDLKAGIRARLSKAGANEVLTYSFVHGNLLDKTGQDRAKAYEIANALSPDLQYYRLSLMPSLLEKVHPNIKAGYDEFALFELGKTHGLDHKDDAGLPGEFEFTALVVTANDKLKRAGAPYYQARKYLETLTGAALSFKPISKDMLKYPVVQPYDPNRAALVSFDHGDFLGIIGEFRPGIARALKLPKYTAGFEIDTTALHLQAGFGYSPLFRFPGVKQDITLKVAADLPYQELYRFIDTQSAVNNPKDSSIQVDLADIYQKPDDPGHKQVTFRVVVTGENRTLTDKEVTAVLDAIAASAKTKFKAERI